MVKKDKFVSEYTKQYMDHSDARKLAMSCGLEVRTRQAGKNEVLQVRASERSQFMDVRDWVDNHITNIRERALQAVERAERLGLTGIGESVQKSGSQHGDQGVINLVSKLVKKYNQYSREFDKFNESHSYKVNLQRAYACSKSLVWLQNQFDTDDEIFCAADSVFFNLSAKH